MKNTSIAMIIMILLMACSQQQRVTNHMAPVDYGEKGPYHNSERIMSKLEDGVDFMASGNEPSWSLETDFDKNLIFKSLQGDSILIPTPRGVKIQDVAATGYQYREGSTTFALTIFDKECEDNMSGKEFPKTVQVTLNNKTFKGCGFYLADYRLNDIWVLENINDIPLDKAQFQKGLPRMEFNLTNNQIFAFTGCNEFNGTIEVQGNKIRFGRFLGTLTACQNMSFESEYISKITNKVLPFQIQPGKLFLQVSADSTFQYKKVD